MELPVLMDSDSITAAWFWITSESTGPYAEREHFDVVFTRSTNTVVGGGYYERRTLYIQDVSTAEVDSRRENGGRIVRGEPTALLAHVIADAVEAEQAGSLAEWASEYRGTGDYRQALLDAEDYATLVQCHAAITAWLGDDYDTYVKAAQEYAAEH